MKIKVKQGYIQFRRIGKRKHNLFELQRIEVYPKYRQQGIGKALFVMMLNKIGDYRKLFCTTHASNLIAHAFYEKMGMKKEAVIPTHYYDNEPELVYGLYSQSNENEKEE